MPENKYLRGRGPDELQLEDCLDDDAREKLRELTRGGTNAD